MTSLSEAKRALLAQYLRGSVAQPGAGGRAMRSRPPDESAPLSFAQEQFWRRETNTPGIAPLYNECITLEMRGPLNVTALERSLREIISRHEVWRTSYDLENGQPIQIVHPAPDDIHLEVIDLRVVPQSKREQKAQQLAREVVGQHFDLTRGPLWRSTLIRMEELEHRLYVAAHLSIVDGVSVYQIFPSELAALYIAFASGQPSPLPAPPAAFCDYAYWQREWVQGHEMGEQLAYWRRQLAGELPALQLPGEQLQALHETGRGSIRSFGVSRAAAEGIKTLAHQEGVTLFMGLLAAFVTFLHGCTRQEDLVVGTLSPSGRKQSRFQKVMGHFLNPVALRFDLTANPTFRQLLRQAQRLTLEAISNDDVPIGILQQELRSKLQRNGNSLFRVAISLQPPMPAVGLDWSVTSMDVESGGSPWDLYLAFIDRPEGMSARVQYNSDVFAAETIATMWEQFETLLGSLSNRANIGIREYEFCPEQAAAAPLA